MVSNLPNYYKLLGVLATSSAEEIKAAYRKLAKDLHPDLNSAETATERFQLVMEAYKTLSDPERRKIYDTARAPVAAAEAAPTKPGVIEGVTNMVGGLIGEIGRRWSLGQDLRYTVNLSFAEACLGCEKQVKFESPVRCPSCKGRGERAGTDCPDCQGHGVRVGERAFKISVPPGTGPGRLFRIPGGGTPGERGGPEGDLTFIVNVEEHPLLERDELNLRCRVPIPVTTALAGGSVEVPTLEGFTSIRVPESSETGQVLRLDGRGIPTPDGGRGNLLFTLDVELPGRLTEAARQLLAEAERQSPPDAYPRTRGYRARLQQLRAQAESNDTNDAANTTGTTGTADTNDE
ncbi:MAG: DnaJ C-terminal domain-containing protein [bacterium]